MSRLHEISGCQNAHRKADVIFVHGLGGDPFTTWKSAESASWPHWLGEDVPQVGVWSLGYAASPSKWMRVLPWIGFGNRDSGHTMALPDRAAQVLDRMVLEGFGERPLLFIGHSLGGLLTKQLLWAAQDSKDPRRKKIAEMTRAVLFLGTPHSGAPLASLVDRFRLIFGSTVSIEDLKAHDAQLRQLFNWYRNHCPHIATRTYFEQRPVAGVRIIVDSTTAHPGVGDDPVAADEDHLSIAKPRDRDALVYLAALDLLRRHVLTGPPPETLPPPSAAVRQAASAPPEIVARVDTGAPKPHPVPCQLPPAAAKRFFGRTAELEKLEARLRAGTSTAVVGPGGLGKTALAAEALRRVVGNHGEKLASSPYRDGIVYLDLYAWQGSAELAWNTLASSLEGGEFLASAPARQRATEACRGRRLLVIVEGGEVADGKEGRARIEDLFAVLDQQNRRLLLTREPLQTTPAESVTLREALDPADAEKLLDSLSEKPLAGPLRERVLDLLQGHPLALTWAGNLLARGDEPARRLVEEWEQDPMLRLSDPKKAEHSLKWLFERSLEGLDEAPKMVLEAAGLLAHAPFPEEWIAAVVSPEEARASLRTLVQRGFLRLAEKEECWQFGHVLAYRFARVESGSDVQLRESLAIALRDSLRTALHPGGDLTPVATILDHIAALLRADDDQRLWMPLVNPLVYAVYHQLLDRGRLPLAERVLAAVRGFFDRLPDEPADESSWKRERASMLDREGHLRLEQGDLAAALAAYREWLEISRRLAAADASNATWHRDLGISHNKVSGILEAQGDLAGALASCRESLEIRQRLASADASNATWQRDLGVSHEKVGGILQAQGDLAGALASYRESLEISQRLASADASNATWQRDLSVSHNKVGGILQAQGDLASALASYRESLEIRRRLASADASNATRQRDLGISHNKVGGILQAQGNLAGALASYRKGLESARRLASADASNATWQRDLGVSHAEVGGILQAQGDLAGALASYRESLDIRRRLASADASNATWQRDLGVSHDNVGGILEAQGDLAGALASYRESLEIARRLASTDASNATWQRDLSVCHDKVGGILEAQGDLAGALAACRESLEIRRRLASADASNATWQRDLGVSHNNVGGILEAQGDLAGALASYRESLEILRRLASADSSNATWQRDLSFVHFRMATLQEKLGEPAEALRLAEESLAIDEKLAALDPTNVTWQNDVEASRGLVERLRRG